jgi:hypothetical protein
VCRTSNYQATIISEKVKAGPSRGLVKTAHAAARFAEVAARFAEVMELQVEQAGAKGKSYPEVLRSPVFV